MSELDVIFKFGVSAVERVCGFDAIDDLVVDRPLPAELARIVQAGRSPAVPAMTS